MLFQIRNQRRSCLAVCPVSICTDSPESLWESITQFVRQDPPSSKVTKFKLYYCENISRVKAPPSTEQLIDAIRKDPQQYWNDMHASRCVRLTALVSDPCQPFNANPQAEYSSLPATDGLTVSNYLRSILALLPLHADCATLLLGADAVHFSNFIYQYYSTTHRGLSVSSH